jgi:hypothetical protein
VRRSGGSYNTIVEYRFQTSSGASASGSFQSAPQRDEVGNIVPVIYLPDDPAVNIVGQEITPDDLRSHQRKESDWVWAGLILGGALTVLFALASLWSLLSALRDVRFARRGEVATATVQSVDAGGIECSYTLPGCSPVVKRVGLIEVKGHKIQVGDELPMIYDPKRPERAELFWALDDIHC